MKGKIIAIEGIDGSGKNTQATALHKFLASKGFNCQIIHFPSYQETFFGKEVGNYLNGEFGGLEVVPPKMAALLYAGDRFEKKEYIVNELNKGTILICDRYVSSNIGHQVAKLPPAEQPELIKWIEELEYSVYKLPQPDRVIFLDMSPEIAEKLVLLKAKRDYTDKKQDLHEADQDYLKNVYKVYLSLSEKPNWTKVSCEENNSPKTAEDISKDLINKVLEILDIK